MATPPASMDMEKADSQPTLEVDAPKAPRNWRHLCLGDFDYAVLCTVRAPSCGSPLP